MIDKFVEFLLRVLRVNDDAHALLSTGDNGERDGTSGVAERAQALSERNRGAGENREDWTDDIRRKVGGGLA